MFWWTVGFGVVIGIAAAVYLTKNGGEMPPAEPPEPLREVPRLDDDDGPAR